MCKVLKKNLNLSISVEIKLHNMYVLKPTFKILIGNQDLTFFFFFMDLQILSIQNFKI